jgi:hypothetical protein
LSISSQIRKKPIPDPGVKKGTGSRIRIRNNAKYMALTLEDLWMTGATTAVGFGAAFRWVRRSSVRPPNPIDVKKLIANLNNKR